MRKERNRRQYAADPTLTALAHDVEYLTFQLTDEEYLRFNERWKEDSLINVALFPDGRTFRVRICLGGKQRIIGLTKRGPEAAIFADIARLFFWNYRMRSIRPPADADFNYSLELAKTILEENDVAARLLERIRDHLVSTAEIKVVSELSTQEGDAVIKIKERRRTVRGAVEDFLNEQIINAGTQQKEFSDMRAANTEQYEQIKAAFHHLLEKVESLEKQNTQLKECGLANLETVLTAIRRLGEPQTGPFSPPPAPFLVSPAHPDWTYIPDNPTPGPATPPPVWCQDKTMPPTS